MDRKYVNTGFLVIGLLVVLISSPASAQNVREVNIYGTWFSGLGAIETQAQSDYNCSGFAWNYDGWNGSRHQWSTDSSCDPGPRQFVAWMFEAACFNGDPVDPQYACDAPPACDGSLFGQEFGWITGDGSTAPATLCDDESNGSGCSLTRSGISVGIGNKWGAMYTYSDQSCGSEPTADEPTDENCISTGDLVYCSDTNNDNGNCGTVNGEYVCLDSVPDGGCIFTADGQAICDGGAVAGTPDETIGDGDGNNFDVFGNGTGGGGTATGTDDGTVANRGTNGQGPGGNGDGGEQPGDCDGTNCTGTLPDDNEAVDDFGTLFGSFYGRVENAPLIAAYAGLSGSMPAGSCSGFNRRRSTHDGRALPSLADRRANLATGHARAVVTTRRFDRSEGLAWTF